MPEGTTFSGQRDEIKLYMEKGFQASCGSFAALVASLALSKTSYSEQIASTVGTAIDGMLMLLVLVLNLFYLVLLLSCLFAILKRGLFILRVASEPEKAWEIFARDPANFNVWRRGNYWDWAWNIDNWFMVPVVFVIVSITAVLAVVAIHSMEPRTKYIAIAIVLLHVFPIWMAHSLYKLNRECHRLTRQKCQIDGQAG
jgi:hypothetical protein